MDDITIFCFSREGGLIARFNDEMRDTSYDLHLSFEEAERLLNYDDMKDEYVIMQYELVSIGTNDLNFDIRFKNWFEAINFQLHREIARKLWRNLRDIGFRVR